MKKLFVFLGIMMLVSCGKTSTKNENPTIVPHSSTTKEEENFDPNYRSKDTESDNLRGWDPASEEDDMEDMGMTRYQENYDEEGWD